MKRNIIATLVTALFILGFTTMASAESASISVSDKDLVVTVAKAEVLGSKAPQIRGVFTGWKNQPMTDSGAAWTYTKKGGAVYAKAAEFCIDLGGEDYLPEKASDFEKLMADGKVLYKDKTKGHNYLLSASK